MFHHTSNASLRYLVKLLCSKIAVTWSCVKRTAARDSAVQNICWKYLPTDVSIISVHWWKDLQWPHRKTYRMTDRMHLQQPRRKATP